MAPCLTQLFFDVKLSTITGVTAADFSRNSSIHGAAHVNRVIVIGQYLAAAVNLPIKGRLALWASCFLHDLEGFVNKERFDLIVPALCSQLKTGASVPKEQYKDVVDKHLAPCVAQVSVCEGGERGGRELGF